MFSTFGIFTVAFLESRLGSVGAVITETIVGIGASPRVAGAPLIRILGIVARELRQRGHVGNAAGGNGWIGWACGLLLAAAALLGSIFSDSLSGALASGRSVATMLARKHSEISVVGQNLRESIEGALMSAGRMICLGPVGMRPCHAIARHTGCLGAV
jgi:hypothetical protein